MKNFLLSVCAVYGVSVSCVAAYGFFKIDLPQLEKAVSFGSERAEVRHRINVHAEGNWILFGNIITTIAIAGIKRN